MKDHTMTALTQALLAQAASGNLYIDREVSSFSPAEIRQTIADLVTQERMDLAHALVDAGLSLYPESEDVVSISALVAELRQDWGSAQALLQKLIALQGGHGTPFAWQHLVRVLRCQFENTQALAAAEQAVSLHPGQITLEQELQALREMHAEHQLLATPGHTH